MKRILTLAIAATTLVGLSACGSDKSSSIPKVNDGGAITLPGGDTINPSDLSLPGNLTEECKAIALQFAALYTQAFSPEGDQGDLEKVFGDMSANVPDDLKDDLAVLLTAFSDYAKVVKDNGSDMTKPEVQAALAALSTPEVSAASDNITAYFDATCPQN
jgi:hypothetical protein